MIKMIKQLFNYQKIKIIVHNNINKSMNNNRIIKMS